MLLHFVILSHIYANIPLRLQNNGDTKMIQKNWCKHPARQIGMELWLASEIERQPNYCVAGGVLSAFIVNAIKTWHMVHCVQKNIRETGESWLRVWVVDAFLIRKTPKGGGGKVGG